MISLLARFFIPEHQHPEKPHVRRAYGILCSVMGIALNILLFAGKYIAGWLSSSIAITVDAFNNLSDAGSSLITLIGFRFAGKKPDPEHPFGHGRIEYLSGLAVAMLIILMGVELFKSSLDKILHPSPTETGPLAIAILLVSIAVKLYMFYFNRRLGRKLNSSAMQATATDSLSDATATAVVLLSLLITYLTDWNADGWCGMLVALFILYAGITTVKETISPLLGQPPDPEVIQQVEQIVLSHPEIIGIHDLVVQDYGPGRLMISLHGEVANDGDINLLHDTIDQAETELNEALNCESVIHMDPIAVDDAAVEAMRAKVVSLIQTLDAGISIHDFRMTDSQAHRKLIFDAVVPHRFPGGADTAHQQIIALVESNMENCSAVVRIDRPYAQPNH